MIGWAGVRAAMAMVALLLVGQVRPVAADPAASAQARELYETGQARFKSGQITEAIDAFERGYTLDPRPEFLLNLAQSYRALGRRTEAISYFERFIAAAPDHELRPAAERTLAELREAEEAARKTPPPDAPPPSSTAPPPRQAPRALPIVPAPREEPVQSDPSRGSSRVWLWVAAGAVLVAGGGLALWLGTRGGEDTEVIDPVRLPDP